MIKSVRLTNFKNFADETLRVGPFTVIIGANASGKSNIRDAFRFLRGIGRGYTLADIIGGRYGPGGQLEWEPIRGAAKEIIRFGQADFSFDVGMNTKTGDVLNYSITVSKDTARPDNFIVTREELKCVQGNQPRTIYSIDSAGSLPIDQPCIPDPEFRSDPGSPRLISPDPISRWPSIRIQFISERPVLTQFLARPVWLSDPRIINEEKSVELFPEDLDILREVVENLGGIRFLDPAPDRMRRPSFPGQTTLGDGGENLPTVLREICHDPNRKRTLVSWIDELTPMDVNEFEFPTDPDGRIYLVLQEKSGRKVSANAASDGTLRFIAILAALLGENPARIYFFEEIDNGIHPSRMFLLLDFIERQTAKGLTQVVTTTHSPDLLHWSNDTSFEKYFRRLPRRIF